MFTGIVESKGVIESIERNGKGAHVVIRTDSAFLKDRVRLGDSIATNGVCLTATALREDAYEADLSFESVNLTCFGFYSPGTEVNLELACTPHTRLGGHIMQGHVDGVGTVLENYRVDDAINIWIQAPQNLKHYIAMKGSIAVDGISLTVNEVRDCDFRLTLIPHTQQEVATSFRPGSKVNLEVDVLARYLERLLQANSSSSNNQSNSQLTLESLQKNGFFQSLNGSIQPIIVVCYTNALIKWRLYALYAYTSHSQN